MVQKYVPSKLLSTIHHLPWLSPSLKQLIKKIQRLYNTAKFYNKSANWVEYKTLQHRVRNLLRSSHYNYLHNSINSASDTANCKSFLRYIKSKRQDFTGIGSLKTSNGDIVTEPFDKAEILNNHFKSVFTLEDQYSVPDMGISPYPSISGIEITLQGVINLLANCDSNKSPGPDKISPHFGRIQPMKLF